MKENSVMVIVDAVYADAKKHGTVDELAESIKQAYAHIQAGDYAITTAQLRQLMKDVMAASKHAGGLR